MDSRESKQMEVKPKSYGAGISISRGAMDAPRPANSVSTIQKKPASQVSSNGVSYPRVASQDTSKIGTKGPTASSSMPGPSSAVQPIRIIPQPVVRVGCFHCGRILSAPPASLPNQARRFCNSECANASTASRVLSPTIFTSPSKPFSPKIVSTKSLAPNKRPEVESEIMRQQLKNRALDDQEEESSRSSIAEDPCTTGRSSSSASNSLNDSDMPPKKKKKKGEDDNNWAEMLQENPKLEAANVSLIKHAPLSRMWENVTLGMKLEVENTDIDYKILETAFWVASVIEIKGYYVRLRYEGFSTNASGDFWINLCSKSVHHVGWCANKGKPLIPPKSIARKFTDWRNFLVHRLTGARTLPLNFQLKVANGLQSEYKLGDRLEVVDKNQISQLRLASIKQIVGRRLHVEYFDSHEDGGFWCHDESRLIHPIGWAHTIGHQILAPTGYAPLPLKSTIYDAEYESMDLRVGMKIEAIDPLNLSAICAATIKQVLNRGYVMVRVDCYEEDSSGADWFCYHISSPYVFHCGFASENGIMLTPPTGYDKATFSWDDYFEDTETDPAPVKQKKPINHKFKVGMKVEAADLMDPRLICVATISRVVGRLLKIHFDGWEDEYDQWLDARSPDIYPIGWCELVDHRLEPPHTAPPIPKPQPTKKAKKGKKKVGGRVTKGSGTKTIMKAPIAPATKPSASKPSTSKRKIEATVMKEKPKENFSSTVQGSGVKDNRPRSSYESAPKQPKLSPSLAKTGNFTNGDSMLADESPVSSSIAKKELASSSRKNATFAKATTSTGKLNMSEPEGWSIENVIEFLRMNDCGPYCDGFSKNDIDGQKLVALTKDQMVLLTGMKVGPAVKIFELVTQLKRQASAAKARFTKKE